MKTRRSDGPVPASAGVGLRAAHYRQVLACEPAVGWFEVHPENYMGAGGLPHRVLAALREQFPLSMHGVGLSLGGEQRPDAAHLQRLRGLLARYEPALVSEHLAWASAGGCFLNDLLPLPYDEATLRRVADHVEEAQAVLGRRLLLENPATYLRFDADFLGEVEFMAALARRSGCALLLDVNNVWVSSRNHDFDAVDYIDAFAVELVGEIHVAGHAIDDSAPGSPVALDSHDRRVAAAVWDLLDRALARTGPLPVLVEWDRDLPEWRVLEDEARRADALLRSRREQPGLAVAG